MDKAHSSEDDSQLVLRIRNGEVGLYRVLVERYSPMIFRLTRRFAVQPSDAEDLAQDVFLKAFNSLSRFERGTDFRSWLFTLGANLCRDYARNVRRKVYPMSMVNEHAYREALSETPAQDREIELADRASALKWALDQLPPEYATVFLMKYQEGMQYKEMAAITTDSVSALKVRVHRARLELQRLLTGKL